MAEASIEVAVRIRPFSPKEAALLAPQDNQLPFLGDGGLGGAPSRAAITNINSGNHNNNARASSLRTNFLRPIISPVDDKVLIFDPPDNNPLSKLFSTASSGFGGTGPKKPKDVRYAFDKVFDDTCGQEMVFENTTKPLLDGILNGFNASVFAYGATGCGKTHTISGTPEDPGVIFLTMKELYRRIEDSRDECEVHVRLSYLEIYNEMIRDLLSPQPTPPGHGLLLREDAVNKISVVGITEHVPASPEEVLEMIQEGNQRRTMSPTEANAVSSRSHAVLQINVTQRPRTADTIMETTSASLNIIDLAGSERASATRNNGQRMKEGANINKSLLALGNCINALCQSGGQKGRHIPYRNSKLTRLLKFSLGGNCKTVMIVCVSPSSAHYDETHNTLKYANQAKNIRTKVSKNLLNVDRHVGQYVQAIQELRQEIAELKANAGNAIESAAERRRKAEVAKETEEVKVKMQQSTANVKKIVDEKVHFEARLLAAQIRLDPLRQRLQELEAEMASYRTQSLDIPSDLESERNVVAGLAAPYEAILADQTLLRGASSLESSMQMQHGIIMAASRNAKLDEAAAETIRNLGNAMVAEVEAQRAKKKLEAMQAAYKVEADRTRDLIGLAARSTITLKEAAGELKYKVGNAEENASMEDLETLSKHLLAAAEANDGILRSITGQVTKPASGNVLRRRPITTAGVGPRVSHISAKTAAGPTSGRVRRGSVVSAAHPSSAGLVSSRLQHLVASPRRPRTSGAAARGRNSVLGSQVGRKSTVVAPRSSRLSGSRDDSLPTVQPAVAKKSFRWADEAGEGSLEGRRSASPRYMSSGRSSSSASSASSSPAMHPPTSSSALSSSTAAGPGPMRRVSAAPAVAPRFAQPTSSSAARVSAKRVAAIAAESDAASETSSGAEWEESGDRGVGIAAASKKPKTSSIFDRNYLTKRASSTTTSSASAGPGVAAAASDDGAEEDDASMADASIIVREPLGDLLANSEGDADSSVVRNASASPPVSFRSSGGGNARVSPYSRRRSHVGAAAPSSWKSGHRLASSHQRSTHSAPTTDEEAGQPASAARVASGPPSFVASRLSSKASNTGSSPPKKHPGDDSTVSNISTTTASANNANRRSLSTTMTNNSAWR